VENNKLTHTKKFDKSLVLKILNGVIYFTPFLLYLNNVIEIMKVEFKNRFEQEIFSDYLENIIDCFTIFKTNDSFGYYKVKRELYYEKNKLRLFVNVPKSYGTNTNCEIVLYGKGFDTRIDCKYQMNKGIIQSDNIIGQIQRNVIENTLCEKELIFIIDGNGFDKENINYLSNYINNNKLNNIVRILSVKDFENYLIKKIL